MSWSSMTLLAIARGGHTLDSIVSTCDYLNHAIIRHGELVEALTELCQRGLIVPNGEGYAPGPAFFSSPALEANSSHRALSAAAALLAASPVVAPMATVTIAASDFERVIEGYLKRMKVL